MSVLISSVWNDTNNRLIISKHIQKRKHFCIVSAPIYLTYLFYFQYGINIYDIFIKQNYIKEFSLAAVLHFIIFFKNFSFVCYDENDSFSLPKTFINTMLCKITHVAKRHVFDLWWKFFNAFCWWWNFRSSLISLQHAYRALLVS